MTDRKKYIEDKEKQEVHGGHATSIHSTSIECLLYARLRAQQTDPSWPVGHFWELWDLYKSQQMTTTAGSTELRKDKPSTVLFGVYKNHLAIFLKPRYLGLIPKILILL